MKPNALVLALLTAATTMPVSARAADDLCSRIFIYAINQICQLLPNGQSLCQPIGLAGAGPNCESPSGGPQLVQIPLGPPAIQMSPFAAPNPYAANPFAANPFAPAPYAPNPYTANPFAGNTYPPFPFAPNLFGPNPYARNQNTPVTAQLQPRAPATTPPSLPVPPVPQAPVPPAVVVAPIPPTTVAEPAATAPAEKPLVKLMPETPPTDTAAVVANATPSASVAEAAPVAPEPVKPAAAPQAAPAPVAAPIAAAETLAVSEAPKPAIDAVAPETSPTPTDLIAAPVTAAQPDDKDAAAKAETDRLQAEKALEDALAHFEFDSAELTPVGRAMLDAWLVQAPGEAPIVVTGHADRLGPEPYNEKLSLLRAEAVKKYLTEKGKPANRIQILAKGEHMPLINCSGGDATPEIKACLAPNRRAEVAIKPASKVVKAKTVAKSTTKNLRKNAKPTKSKSTR